MPSDTTRPHPPAWRGQQLARACATIMAACAGGMNVGRVTTRRRSARMWEMTACVLETWASPRESRARRSRGLCPEPEGAECLVCAPPSWLHVRVPACATIVAAGPWDVYVQPGGGFTKETALGGAGPEQGRPSRGVLASGLPAVESLPTWCMCLLAGVAVGARTCGPVREAISEHIGSTLWLPAVR